MESKLEIKHSYKILQQKLKYKILQGARQSDPTEYKL